MHAGGSKKFLYQFFVVVTILYSICREILSFRFSTAWMLFWLGVFLDVFVFGKDWIRNKKDNNENLCFSVGEVLDN